MEIFEQIAEKRIREAMDRGEFKDLPGAGKPLAFDDDTNVPEDRRLAYKVLKNSGFLPPELETKREMHSLAGLIDTLDGDGVEQARLRKRLNLLRLRFSMEMKRPLYLDEFSYYAEKAHKKIGGEGS